MKFDRKFLKNNSSIMNLYLVAEYGLCHLTSRNLENVKQKMPRLRGPLVKILVFSVVEGKDSNLRPSGYEPNGNKVKYGRRE